MRLFFSLALLALCTSFSAQETITYPYNPDIDADQIIQLEDLLEVLVIYGNAFELGEIMVDDQTLTEYLTALNLLIEAIAMPDGTEIGQILVWNGSAWIPTVAKTGCTDSEACNYDSDATTFDGSCQYIDACGICSGPGEIYECGCEDIPESYCDCAGNQLDALNVCGGTCENDADQDGICDDGDSCVGEADECGVCNGPGAVYACGCTEIPSNECDCIGNLDEDQDGICDYEDSCVGSDSDDDGICDDLDNCDGLEDSCGVCNGPGPIYECGCFDIPEGHCDCAGNELTEDGECQDCIYDTSGDGLFDSACGPCLGETSIEYFGVEYNLIEVGGRCWFQNNLSTVLYNDSSELIQSDGLNDVWSGLTEQGAYCIYGEDSIHGKLYNGYAAGRNVCPQFWDVPELNEWQSLVDSIGGVNQAGGVLKEAGYVHWEYPNEGATNSIGFTALPSGERTFSPDGFQGLGYSAIFWSKPFYLAASDNTETTASGLKLSSYDGSVSYPSHSVKRGHSIRCVRAEPLFGCTVQNFMEYDSEANVNDGSCATPAFLGCTNDDFIEYDPVANLDDGSCHTLLNCLDGDVNTYNGDDYEIVTIGNQCWFAENLRTAYYRNGHPIDHVMDQSEWNDCQNDSTGAWCHYNNSEGYEGIYGKHYNWYVVNDNRGVCPSGWHVPSTEDWHILLDFLGGGEVAANALRISCGTNSSGWNGKSGGYRSDHDFRWAGGGCSFWYGGWWWSTTPWSNQAGLADCFQMYNEGYTIQPGEYSGYHWNYQGASVRCLRDSE
jgi:uncharacterized protein (TIGR02145 family)